MITMVRTRKGYDSRMAVADDHLEMDAWTDGKDDRLRTIYLYLFIYFFLIKFSIPLVPQGSLYYNTV